jgi:hypothetical protein
VALAVAAAAWVGWRAAGDRRVAGDRPAAPTSATAAPVPASVVVARIRLADQARQLALGAGGL